MERYPSIRSVEELVAFLLTHDNPAEFFIQLNHGLRSYKRIEYDEETECFDVCNAIDGSWQELTHAEMQDEGLTNIGEAMRAGAFYAEPNTSHTTNNERRIQ